MQNNFNCNKCGKPVGELNQKIGFRAICPHCENELHSCVNCRYYSVGKPNDCIVPGTEYIRDRELGNYCEDFKVKLPSSSSDREKEQQKFKSLFKDD